VGLGSELGEVRGVGGVLRGVERGLGRMERGHLGHGGHLRHLRHLRHLGKLGEILEVKSHRLLNLM
jgi:hypothetical protein